MLSSLIHGRHGHHHDVKPTIHDPIVKEIVPSPEERRDDPMAAAVLSPIQTNSLTIASKPVLPRPAQLIATGSALGFVKQQHIIIRQRCQHELGADVPRRVFDMTFAGLLEWIRNERLTRLPHKGGAWDKVLISAQYFAEQVSSFKGALEPFIPEVASPAGLIFGHCMLLLELGHENAAALEKAFGLFYQFGLELAVLLKCSQHFRTGRTVEEHLGQLFVDLMHIVTGVAIAFYGAAHGKNSSRKVDIYATFGGAIDTFRSRRMRTSIEMWNHELSHARVTDDCDIETIRKWLAPKDSVLAFLSSNHINLTAKREEFTCMWFHSHLSSFLRGNEKTMMIEGRPGSGKTTLAGWIVDTLQRRFVRRTFSTLSFSVNPSVAGQSTSLALVRTLLYQLVEQRIGDVRFYKILHQALTAARSQKKLEDYESSLWNTLEKSLEAINDDAQETTVIVLDGIDEIAGQKPAAQRVSTRLHNIVQKFGTLRLIQLSTPMSLKLANSNLVNITADQNGEDIRTVLRQSLMRHEHFRDRNHPEQEAIIDRLASTAGDSMLWATLACDYIRLQTTHAAVTEAVDSLDEAGKGTDAVLQKVVVSLKLNSESKHLLSCLAACARPMSLAEIGILMQVDTERSTVRHQEVDVPSLIKSLGHLVLKGEGLVCMRHESIRQQLIMLSAQNKIPLQLTHRHKELVTRLFVYAKSCLNNGFEASLDAVEPRVAQRLFSSHELLEYTVCYYMGHFKRSSWYKASGQFHSFDELRAVFPSSVTLAVLERSCWMGQFQSFDTDALDFHKDALRLREALFGQKHASVLQSALSCAYIAEHLSLQSESVVFYGRAMTIGKVVAGVQAHLTIVCGEALLRLSETLITKSRTEIMTFREEALLILVSAYKHIHGTTSLIVIETYKKLSAFYVYIGEEKKAEEIYIIIRQITIRLHGPGSEEEKSICRDLNVVLKKHEHAGAIDTFDGSIFADYEEESVEVWDVTRIDLIIKIAAELVIKGEFFAAEEKYIELWLRISEQCRATHLLVWHEKKIQVLLAYALMLHTCKRSKEASSLLLCIWREYEHHEFASHRSIIVLLREVAASMKVVGLFAVALSVFKKCWSWFKSSKSEEHISIEEEITTVTHEIVKTTTVTTTTTSETTIREVFESSSSSSTEITSTHVELCKSLVTIYMEQKRYSEVTSIIKTVLKKGWSSFFSASYESLTLVAKFHAEMIEIATNLAVCYIAMSKIEKAEEIYFRLFISIRSSRKCDDALFIRFTDILIAFYEQHQYHDKLISFYQSLLVSYRAFYGATHKLTIKLLYALGGLCREHYRTHGYFLEYYLEIITVLNKGLEICHEDALEALLIVADIYYEDCRYSECLQYYKLITATFFKLGTHCTFFKDATTIMKIFACYFRSLEISRTDIEVQISIFKSYREHCIKFFGATASITIEATMQLAMIYCRSEMHEHFAIELYEFVCKHSSSTEVISKTQLILKSLYIKKVTKSSTTTTITKETCDTTTTIIHGHYTETRKKLGCVHKSTWSQLKELIFFYHRFEKTELAIQELKAFIVECFSHTSITSKEMVEVALFAAEIYTACGFVSHGFELIQELKMQIICKSTLHVGKWGFNLTTHGREWFVFIAAFWSSLHLEMSFTECMAEIAAEALYYERFMISIKQSTDFKVIMFAAARLHSFLVVRKRTAFFVTIEHQLYEAFCKINGAAVKGSTETSIRMFLGVMLGYFSNHLSSKRFVYSAGYAATEHVRLLIKEGNHKAAYELATCTYKFLMAREGLDDLSEIGLGFQLTLLMAGHGTSYSRDANLRTAMLKLSNVILSEVLDICEKAKIDMAQLSLADLNELICLMGEQKDYQKLQSLLYKLWVSRESQTSWSEATKLALARRLIEVRFSMGERAQAIRLCEDIVYNVRRVHGARHANTLQFIDMLGRLYTSTAMHYAGHPATDKNAQALARAYFKKAMAVHEDALKQFVEAARGGYESEDEDLDSEIGSSAGTPPPTKTGFTTRAQQLEAEGKVRSHLLLLKRTFQRLGGWNKSQNEYETLTGRVWETFGEELKLAQENVHAGQWSAKSYGAGKAEGDEDMFVAPKTWTVMA